MIPPRHKMDLTSPPRKVLDVTNSHLAPGPFVGEFQVAELALGEGGDGLFEEASKDGDAPSVAFGEAARLKGDVAVDDELEWSCCGIAIQVGFGSFVNDVGGRWGGDAGEVEFAVAGEERGRHWAKAAKPRVLRVWGMMLIAGKPQNWMGKGVYTVE